VCQVVRPSIKRSPGRSPRHQRWVLAYHLPVAATVWILLAPALMCCLSAALAAASVSKPPLTGNCSADLGLVDGLTQQEATHVFTLANSTTAPLELTSIRGSCGCEDLAYLVNSQRQQSITLQPGEIVAVQMGVRLSGQPPIPVTKTAWLIGAAGNIVATLSLSLQVREPYRVQPAHLDLGDVPAGGTKTALVTVDIDKSLLPTEQFPAFVTDTPGVTAIQSGAVTETQRDGKQSLAAEYLVTASHLTSVGSATARLSFALKVPSGQLDTISLPVSANVVGDFAVSPKAVYFGAVSVGASPVRDLIVTGATAASLQQVRVLSGSPNIAAQVIPSEVGGDSNHAIVRITLSGKPPAGRLQTYIILTYSESQTLTVPVTATVVTSP